jgi:sigma-B regulation protein RsbU (phosphoserine phosphatase)
VAKKFFDDYTRGLTSEDVQRLFTRDTPEAYRYFTRGLDLEKIRRMPFYKRWWIYTRELFVRFSMRLTPARRFLYGASVFLTVVGLMELFRGVGGTRVLLFLFHIDLPLPHWEPGAVKLLLGFLGLQMLMLMEIADRLSLKGELEIARDIQLAMLPSGTIEVTPLAPSEVEGASGRLAPARACGLTRPANTVGGDFYDILPLPDGRLIVTVGDVSGKGSPAALLMALLLAMMRTLVDEGLESARLLARLNTQIVRHAPGSRFITLFYGLYDPRTGGLEYVNAGHLPPLIHRSDGSFERLTQGNIALGMFAGSTYEAHEAELHAGDALILYSDGITEAENDRGQEFDEAHLSAAIAAAATHDPEKLGRAILAAVDRHAGDVRLVDDLTVLVLSQDLPATGTAQAG